MLEIKNNNNNKQKTQKTVTYTKISPKMVKPIDLAGNPEEEEEEERSTVCSHDF